MKSIPIITSLFFLYAGTLAELGNPSLKQRIQKYGKGSLKDVIKLARASLPLNITLYNPDLEFHDDQASNSLRLSDRLSLCEMFQSNYDPATVEIDYHPFGHGPFTGSQWIDNIVTVTDTLETKWENSHEVGGDANFHANSLFSYHFTHTRGGSETNAKAKSTSIKGIHKCPDNRTCEVVTMVFTFKATGSYYKMPVIDFKSLPTDIRWRYKDTDLYHHLTKSSKLAIASLAGKSNALDYLGAKHYSLRDRASKKTVKETPPGGRTVSGIEWPPESVQIDYKQSQSGEVTMPLEDYKGTRLTANIQVEYDFEDETKSTVKVLSQMKPQ
ncbi:hypothetical protein CDD80_2517 [Ophiocordyceps camponoti-rufipedis]|uniref:Uncharacterized protein n=1 Tax=Ophiocordyceps camponoti-rufipedis TaxID=2004952 RepID=A0A2C5YAY9_9HYPO|nr:hypothetical protein CDD80_2517 [Ophiocordyceps camponoti-rufipedis]